MTMKSLLTVGALTLASLSIASAKSYDIMLDGPTKVGNTELKAGQYKVKVEGSQVVFMDAQSAKTWTAPVKTQTSDRKFDRTTVQTTNQSGSDSLREIDLGGSTTRLQFGE